MKYKISWSKTYRTSGEEIIEADDELDAELKGYDLLGDFEGTMQYYPENSEITSVEKIKKE